MNTQPQIVPARARADVPLCMRQRLLSNSQTLKIHFPIVRLRLDRRII